MPTRRRIASWLVVLWTVMLSGGVFMPARAAMPGACPQMAQQSMDAMPCCASHEHGAHRHDTGCQTLCAVSNGTGPQPGTTVALELSHVPPASAAGFAYPMPLRGTAAVVSPAPPPSVFPPPSTRLLL